MKYSITIHPVKDDKIAKIIARYLTSRGNRTSFSELIQMLQYEQFLYAEGVSATEMQEIKKQLDDLGVTSVIKEMVEDVPVEKIKEIAPEPEVEPVTLPEKKTPPKRIPERSVEEKKMKQVDTAMSKKTKIRIAISMTSIIMLVILLIIAFAPKNETIFDISESSISGVSGGGSAPASQVPPSNESPAERQSREALESADQQCVSSGINTEKLYRFAIEYNRQNLDAWFGLLNCYKATDRAEEASEVREEMKSIFGTSILTPQKYLDEFGSLEVVELNSSSGSFVYVSNETSLDRLYSDLFRITRRISAASNVYSLTVLGKMRDGKGVFLTISLGECIEYSDFVESATFQELQ